MPNVTFKIYFNFTRKKRIDTKLKEASLSECFTERGFCITTQAETGYLLLILGPLSREQILKCHRKFKQNRNLSLLLSMVFFAPNLAKATGGIGEQNVGRPANEGTEYKECTVAKTLV